MTLNADSKTRLAAQDACVLRLRRLHRVGLHDRGDIGNQIVPITAVAANLVVPQIRHHQLVIG